MPLWKQQNISTFVSTIAIGAGVIVLTYLCRKIVQLNTRLDSLQRELAELRSGFTSVSSQMRFYSVHGSSRGELTNEEDDDDDEFLEAYGSEYDFVASTHDVILSPAEREFYQIIDSLIDQSDQQKQKAYALLQQNKHKYGHDVNFLWRYAKAIYFMSQLKSDAEEKKTLVFEARDVAENALDVGQNDANAHKWYGIMIGCASDYESITNRIKIGYKFKHHIEIAIRLAPEDHSLYYLIGRWCYEVSQLSWMERQVASTLFATPPAATVDEALIYFMKADTLSKDPWKENMLYVAKCYIQKSDYVTALEWLDKADGVDTTTRESEEAQVEVTDLLRRYNHYR